LYKNIKLSDAVHIHEFIYPTSIIGFIFAKITNKTIVITQHIGYIPYKNRVFASLLSIANKTIGRIILGNADAVIFISNNVLNYFKSFIAAKNFYLQTNSVDIHNFLIYPEIKRKYLRHELNVESYNSIVLFVGRFTEKKGINKIIDFARKYKKILWLFVGWGNIHPEQYSLANVKVINDIDHSKMPDYYNSADYLFLPSYGEGFPLVIQEAFACGLQVLTTTENSVAYPQAEHLIINYDIDDLESWNYLFERIDARVHPNHHNPIDLRNFAIGHWSEEKNGDFYLSLFQELLIGKRRQS